MLKVTVVQLFLLSLLKPCLGFASEHRFETESPAIVTRFTIVCTVGPPMPYHKETGKMLPEQYADDFSQMLSQKILALPGRVIRVSNIVELMAGQRLYCVTVEHEIEVCKAVLDRET